MELELTTAPPTKTPKLIFIVPYRDREQQMHFFIRQMKYVMEDYDESDYKIYFAHQCDNRGFNRGAMKNVGFMVMREMYPDTYKNITFVFNDVDTMPFTKNFLNYETKIGVVKHFYGFEFALGGIVSICGADFEKVNGFPNFFGWAYEDNSLNMRVKNAGLIIDRSQFYPIMDKNILQLKDGLTRLVNRGEFDRYYNKTTEGISSIKNLKYNIDESKYFINIEHFLTEYAEDKRLTKVHDIRNGARPFNPPPVPKTYGRKGNPVMKMFI